MPRGYPKNKAAPIVVDHAPQKVQVYSMREAEANWNFRFAVDIGAPTRQVQYLGTVSEARALYDVLRAKFLMMMERP